MTNIQNFKKESTFDILKIKNVVIMPSVEAKKYFLEVVYPHNIDCIVFHKDEVFDIPKNCKIAFFGCYNSEFLDNEHIIMDDILYSSKHAKPYTIRWSPESLATFLRNWFLQDALRKTSNNLKFRFETTTPKEGHEWVWKMFL